jgi:hypothetical protein
MEGKCAIRLGLNFHRAIFRHDIAAHIMILKIALLWGRPSFSHIYINIEGFFYYKLLIFY